MILVLHYYGCNWEFPISYFYCGKELKTVDICEDIMVVHLLTGLVFDVNLYTDILYSYLWYTFLIYLHMLP